eukprot:jgi/Mesen1/9720/ME000693S09269
MLQGAGRGRNWQQLTSIGCNWLQQSAPVCNPEACIVVDSSWLQMAPHTTAPKDAPAGPPKPLLVAVPKGAGLVPVVQLQHGFSLQNSYYSQLISHVASHGFIVVAPQLAGGAEDGPLPDREQ